MAMTVDMCRFGSFMHQDTIINTSCEHLEPEKFLGWWGSIPRGKCVVLQSNNYFEHEEHVNAVNNVDELMQAAPMQTVLYKGSMDTHLYTRFMVIGVK